MHVHWADCSSLRFRITDFIICTSSYAKEPVAYLPLNADKYVPDLLLATCPDCLKTNYHPIRMDYQLQISCVCKFQRLSSWLLLALSSYVRLSEGVLISSSKCMGYMKLRLYKDKTIHLGIVTMNAYKLYHQALSLGLIDFLIPVFRFTTINSRGI